MKDNSFEVFPDKDHQFTILETTGEIIGSKLNLIDSLSEEEVNQLEYFHIKIIKTDDNNFYATGFSPFCNCWYIANISQPEQFNTSNFINKLTECMSIGDDIYALEKIILNLLKYTDLFTL